MNLHTNNSFLLFFFTLCFFLNEFNNKKFISNYISNKYLIDSKYYIETDSSFSICFWFRLLENNNA